MSRWCYRDIFSGNIDSQAQALLIYIGEVFFSLFRIFMSYVEVDVVVSTVFHFIIDSTRYDIARCQRQTGIIFLHELFPVHGTKYTTVSPHRLGNEERRTIARMVKRCRVELYEFHIFYGSFRPIYHGNAVAGCYKRVGCSLVDSPYSTCCH